MITSADATLYLDQALSISVPSFLVDAAVAKVATVEQAMIDAGYSAADIAMIQTYAVAIIASAGAPRRLTSQHAPSGASRSFKPYDGDLSALRRSRAALDPAGLLAGLLGVDPTASTLFMVVC